MESNRNVAEALQESTAKANEAPSRPAVTSSGQVVWSTRDLLFPAGHSSRTAVVTKVIIPPLSKK